MICNVGHGHSHSNDPIMESNVTFPRARLATVGSIFNVEGNLVEPCKRSLEVGSVNFFFGWTKSFSLK